MCYSILFFCVHAVGIYTMKATSLAHVVNRAWFNYSRRDKITSRVIINGYHPGCTERLRDFGDMCQFDGKVRTLARYLHSNRLLPLRIPWHPLYLHSNATRLLVSDIW